MSLSVDGFLKQLSDSGILSSDDISALESQIPSSKRTKDAQSLVKELVRLNILTSFQAGAIYNQDGTPLTLGNYVLQDKIGSGGMGVVYKAQHRRMKRTVAIKLLSPQAVQSAHVVKRFLREAEAAAKLTHPNIVAAYDADEVQGVPFLAMEYVDGIDLSAYIKQKGPMELEQAIGIVLQIARGLEHAHQQGIVHRDIKPANVLLDTNGVAKILDMGLARIHEGRSPTSVAESAALTHAGTIVGTIDFMSPEQAIDSRQADQSSDIYSLGATFFFLLTGRPMYESDNLMARLIAHREAPLPSICAIRLEAPAQIDAIFHLMVAKKKEDRYASMSDVVKDLENWKNITAKTDGSSVQIHSNLPKNVVDFLFDDE